MKNRMLAALIGVNKRTRTEMYQETLAQIEQRGGDLQVLNDPGSFSTLMKIYQRFINDGDLRGLPTFMMEVDQLLQDFGGHPKPAEPKYPEGEEGEGEGEGPPAQPDKPQQPPPKRASRR